MKGRPHVTSRKKQDFYNIKHKIKKVVHIVTKELHYYYYYYYHHHHHHHHHHHRYLLYAGYLHLYS